MSDKRCGTCRHFTQYDYGGVCAIGAFLGKRAAYSGETGCPGWSLDTPTEAYYSAVDMLLILAPLPREVIDKAMEAYHANYARGWRDALAAAAGKLKDTSAGHLAAAFENQCDKHLAASNALGIAAGELAALTPPG